MEGVGGVFCGGLGGFCLGVVVLMMGGEMVGGKGETRGRCM